MPDKRPDFLKPAGSMKREIFSDESDGMASDDSEESDDVCDYSPRNGDGKHSAMLSQRQRDFSWSRPLIRY